MRITLKLCLLLLVIASTSDAQRLQDFDKINPPTPPDYQIPEHWSALPFRKDAGDYIPKNESEVSDTEKQADVFYVYPTIYGYGKTWNANITKKRLNKQIDKYPVKYQASVFNNSSRIYAPRYRQAIGKVWKNPVGKNESKALDLAYQDVKSAFEYYLQNYNSGRPLIIAAHSQGSYLGRRLIREYFDKPEHYIIFVAAYLIGYAIDSTMYTILKPCRQANETNCYITFSSYKNKFNPDKAKSDFHRLTYGNVCINPTTWTMQDGWSQSEHAGIFLKMKAKAKNRNSALIKDSKYLWVKHNINSFKALRNLHVLDYNLFWFDIRKNVEL